MSILIKGIDMPIDCWNCVCIDKEFGKCQATDTTIYGDIPKWCPLVSVPTPHGRLIDADELSVERNDYDTYNDYSHAFDMVDYAPTVIEAEE